MLFQCSSINMQTEILFTDTSASACKKACIFKHIKDHMRDFVLQ